MLVVIAVEDDYEENKEKKYPVMCRFIILVKSHVGQNVFTVRGKKSIDGCKSQNSTISLACGCIKYYSFSILNQGNLVVGFTLQAPKAHECASRSVFTPLLFTSLGVVLLGMHTSLIRF